MGEVIQTSLIRYQAQLEAVLFAAGNPVSISDLAQTLDLDLSICNQQLDLLEEQYQNMDRGICLVRMNDTVQLCTKEEYATIIQKVLQRESKVSVSSVAMEVLAIIAYNQPVTRGFIEQVRGVNSNHIVNSLLEKELIEEAGRLELPGRPITYRTTHVFLRSFRLNSLEDLPALSTIQEVNPEDKIED